MVLLHSASGRAGPNYRVGVVEVLKRRGFNYYCWQFTLCQRDKQRQRMSTADVRIEQDELETIKRSVLIKSRRLLVDSIDPANHVSYLRSKFIFSERDAEEIDAPPTRSAKAEVFLDKLNRKGSQAYDEFQNSLCRDKTQLFLLTHMTKTLELLKHRVRDFKGKLGIILGNSLLPSLCDIHVYPLL